MNQGKKPALVTDIPKPVREGLKRTVSLIEQETRKCRESEEEYQQLAGKFGRLRQENEMAADFLARLLAGASLPTPITQRRMIPLREIERQYILSALESCSWNIKKTAERLGIGRTSLYPKMRKHGIERRRAE